VSLRLRLLLLVILAIIPAVAIEIYGEVELRATRQGEIREESTRLLRLIRAEQERINEGARQLLVAFAAGRAIRQHDWQQCDEVAAQILSRLHGYMNIGVARDDTGDLLCSALPIPAGKDMRHPHFLSKMTPDGDLFVGTYHRGLITDKNVITLAIPLRDDTGAVTGAWANLDLDWLARHFADRFPSPNMTLLVADSNGTILARLPDNKRWAGKFIGEPYMSEMVRAPADGVTDIVGVDGEERIIAYSPITRGPKGLYLGVGLSKGPYFAPIDAATRQKAMLISLSFALALAAAWFIGSAFVRRPIEGLLVAARRWQAGDYTARAALTKSTSEIGKLGMAFDEMAEAVEAREHQRREAEEALASLNANLEKRVKEEIAEREKAQTALIHSQRLEAIGQLTSGVAHDFNNLLAAVIMAFDLLRSRIGDERGRQILDSGLHAANRGAKLTEQLLAFSRHRHLEPAPFNANDLISGMSDLLERTLGPAIVISRSLAPDLWPVLADASQIEMALLNLVVNARDAMPLGGTLSIETANLPAGDKRLLPELDGSYFVQVAVSDTGIGMSEATKTRAFEPFYTTKEIGKGTGLGLSMVYGIAKQSGGTAVIDSKPGEGTTVALILPRASAAPALSGAARGPETMTKIRGKLLLVDDDRDVRDITVAALADAGADITAVDSGPAALSLIERGTPFDMLIADYAMPGMNGAELIRRVRDRLPRLPVILVTGYAQDALAHLPVDMVTVRKPFRTSEMLEQVRAALAGIAATRENVVPISVRRSQ
jgi:signal transduction histidine kinase/ActR/RegA family two-component response regulator